MLLRHLRRHLLFGLCLILVFTMFPLTAQAKAKAPARPGITSAKVSGSTVQLTWKKAKNAKSYKVFVQTGADGWKYWKKVKANSKNKKKYSDTLKYKLKKSGKKYKVYKRANPYKAVKTVKGLKYTYYGKYSKTYRFVLRAANGKKTSKYSSAKSVKIPAKPQPVKPQPAEEQSDPQNVSYTVSFVNSVTNETIDTRTVKYGCTVDFPSPPQIAEYHFKSWSQPASVTITDNMTIYAEYTKVHRINFINGANNTLIKTVFVEDGGTGTVPTPPVMEGKKFTGWDLPEANSGTIKNVRSKIMVIANYANIYKITCIDGVTNQTFKTIEVEEGKSVSAPAYPSHYNDDKNPWAFNNWSSNTVFDTPVKGDMEVTALYRELYNVNWIDIYDGSIIKTDKVKRPGSGAAPEYPTHSINGADVTANNFVGYDDTAGDSWRNYKNVSDDKCDKPGERVISMYIIYPDVTHKVRIVNASNSSDICSTFYVIDGGDATKELMSRIERLTNCTGLTDAQGNPISSLRNVKSDVDVYAHFGN